MPRHRERLVGWARRFPNARIYTARRPASEFEKVEEDG
jgi:hypothetical protein